MKLINENIENGKEIAYFKVKEYISNYIKLNAFEA